MRRTRTAGLLLLVLLLSGCAARRSPSDRLPRTPPWPTTLREYVLPDTIAFPNDLVVDSVGTVWFTDRIGSRIGRLDPESGAVDLLPTPSPNSAPYGITVAPDGSIWYAASNVGRLGRVDPATGRIEERVLAEVTGGPHSVVARGDRIWFTAMRSGEYGWYDPRTGETRRFEFLPQARVGQNGPYMIVAAGDALWFSSLNRRGIYRVDPESGAFVEVPLTAGFARRLAVDAGGRVWYTNFGASRLGRIDPGAEVPVELPLLRSPAEPYGIAVDAYGRVWFNEARNGLIAAYDPRTGTYHAVEIPTAGATVRGMGMDRVRDRVWLPLSGTHRIGRIDLR